MTQVQGASSDVKLDERLFEETRQQIREALASAYVQAVRTGESTPLRAVMRAAARATKLRSTKSGHMLTIDGVMEIPWGSDRFEAAVHTDEGPKRLEGNVVDRSNEIEIQSGARVQEGASGWQHGIAETASAIREAYDHLQPAEALKTISEVWDHLDRTSELAAARSRILLGKVEKPELAETPKWFVEQKPHLSEQRDGEPVANPLAVTSAELLVRAVLAATNEPDKTKAELDVGPLGRVIVDWLFPESRLQWMVEANDLPWPSVKVYYLAHRALFQVSEPPRTAVLHNAFDVIASFVQFTSGI